VVIHHKNTTYLEKFGKNLKRLRKAKGFSQEKLESAADVSKNQIGNIERGEINTTISTVYLIAKALDTPPKELFDFE
jgi:transcriptional regulator with XRE-family HTH domain